MTTDQYTQLVDFLGRKFARIDEQFDEAKRERQEAKREREEIRAEARHERERLFEESRRHALVLFEQSQANLNTVAEGLGLRMEGVENGLVRLTGRVESLEQVVEALTGGAERTQLPEGGA